MGYRLQLMKFDKEDFRRLSKDVAKRACPAPAWTPKREGAFELSWPTLKASVDKALEQLVDAVHTTRGFIHVAGSWWERVKSDGGGTKLS